MPPQGLAKFSRAKRRVLPLLVLLDASGSMNEVIDEEGMQRTGQIVIEDGQQWEVVTGGTTKLQLTNIAMKSMIASFAAVERAEVQVSVITFGGAYDAKIHVPMKAASEVVWDDYAADGETPMGSAFKIAKQIVEARDAIPSDAYRPTIVLVSDGLPTDNGWEERLDELVSDGRSRKAARMALGIGEADRKMLTRFLGDEHSEFLFKADQATEIVRFFNFLTMSVAKRSNSIDPNEVIKPKLVPSDIDEF
ncbi:MAG TPA: tellurite resistance protein TerY [Planctomycetaceae bacterium]|nr:tellurite resistance protein TerY [Planctomycetaceae bacterium]